LDCLKQTLLSHFTECHESLEQHITDMKRPTVHGDILEVCVIAYMMKTAVHIVQRLNNSRYKITQMIPPLSSMWKSSNEPMVLLFSPEIHNKKGILVHFGHYELLQKKEHIPAVYRLSTEESETVFRSCKQAAAECVSLIDIINSVSSLLPLQSCVSDSSAAKPDSIPDEQIRHDDGQMQPILTDPSNETHR